MLLWQAFDVSSGLKISRVLFEEIFSFNISETILPQHICNLFFHFSFIYYYFFLFCFIKGNSQITIFRLGATSHDFISQRMGEVEFKYLILDFP